MNMLPSCGKGHYLITFINRLFAYIFLNFVSYKMTKLIYIEFEIELIENLLLIELLYLVNNFEGDKFSKKLIFQRTLLISYSKTEHYSRDDYLLIDIKTLIFNIHLYIYSKIYEKK